MRIAIIGGGYAGITCALRLARKARGRADITLVNASDRFVERIRLHQQIAGARPPEHDLARLLRAPGVTLKVGQVTGIDVDAHTLAIDGEPLDWERLVLATGSRTDVDAVPGVRAHALTLDGHDVARLAGRVPALAGAGGRLVVVGGGLTGVESAAELAAAFPGLRVTLVTHRGVGDGWSAPGRAHLVRTLARLGVELREGVRVAAVSATRLETDAGAIPFDLCLWAVGFVAGPLARAAGLAVNERGQVLVDPALRSISHPHVYAAGDAVMPVLPPGLPLPMGCKAAGPAGAHVADNLARALRAAPERAFDFATPFYCVSLGRRDALIQYTRPDGTLTGEVITGRRAAWFKELVCRSTVWALHLERVGFIGTRWLRTGRAPALADAGRQELAA
jgi:NADH dehydrogenase FAD-containing subunit